MLLVRFFRAMRGLVRATLAPCAALAVLARSARGAYRTPATLDLAVLALAIFAALAHASSRRRARRADSAIPPLQGGTALVLVAVAYGLADRAAGGDASAWVALPFVTLAGVSALSGPRVGALVAIAALAHDAYGAWFAGTLVAIGTLVRGVLVVASASLHPVLTRGEIARVRGHAERLLEEERARQREAARSFRLIAAPSAAPRATANDDERRVRGSIDQIRETLQGLLEIARRTLALNTCAVFWLDSKGEQLRPVGFATANFDLVASEPIAVGAGAVGGACAMGRPVVLSKLRPEYGGLTYYSGPHGVRAFAAIPILDDGNVRGVLVADRTDERAFDTLDQDALDRIARQALRHVHDERVFGQLEKTKDELARLFAASRALGEALTEDEVISAMAASARNVAEHDLIVLASYDERTHDHRVRHASGEGSERLTGFAFADNAGIASAAVRTRHALPYRGHFDARTQYVFTRAIPLEGYESVLCLPLVVRDRVLGTMTLASRRRGAFPDANRQLLGVLAAHAAVAMSNAAAVRRLEEMATTDPMTGLLNKRALEAEFERRIRSAARFGKPLSVIVADVDKFKSVNDTYGHAIGDVVLKGLGAILANCKRETDVVARFGGEEFVLVCEETDVDGAFLLAERIRNELAKTVFATEIGPLSVTCSLGVAEFPRDGANKSELFVRADEALYEAKHNGRNQTRVAGKRSAPVVASTRRGREPRTERGAKSA